MRYLTVDEVVWINQEILQEASILRDLAALESATMRPQASAFGQDAYPGVVDKTAALLHSLILNHPLVDGSKRTAVIAVVMFLNQNGYAETWNTDEAYSFVLAIAEGQHDVAQVSGWLLRRTEAPG